mgnify:CR=1 FL=1
MLTINNWSVQELENKYFTRYTAEKLMEVRNTLSNHIEELLAPEMLEIGIRIENDVMITEDGCVDLSIAIPKTVEEIEAIMAK